jgi:hypothetical protein
MCCSAGNWTLISAGHTHKRPAVYQEGAEAGRPAAIAGGSGACRRRVSAPLWAAIRRPDRKLAGCPRLSHPSLCQLLASYDADLPGYSLRTWL